MAALARHGLASSATTLHGLAEPRRTATLLAMARHLDAVAIDDALDLFTLLMTTRLINPSRTASNNARREHRRPVGRRTVLLGRRTRAPHRRGRVAAPIPRR